jgi:hypothetical protein
MRTRIRGASNAQGDLEQPQKTLFSRDNSATQRPVPEGNKTAESRCSTLPRGFRLSASRGIRSLVAGPVSQSPRAGPLNVGTAGPVWLCLVILGLAVLYGLDPAESRLAGSGSPLGAVSLPPRGLWVQRRCHGIWRILPTMMPPMARWGPPLAFDLDVDVRDRHFARRRTQL